MREVGPNKRITIGRLLTRGNGTLDIPVSSNVYFTSPVDTAQAVKRLLKWLFMVGVPGNMKNRD